MAASLKSLKSAFGRMLAQTSNDPDGAIKALRAALVSFERHEINRDRCLLECNRALDAHGVESVTHSDRPIADYVNTGDTYAPTILFSYRAARFYVCSWGDWYERSPEYRAYSRREWQREQRERH